MSSCKCASTNSLPHHRGAFTLVELLVVMAIVAMLVSMLLPALGMARQSAADTSCAVNHKQMAAAIYMYTGDSKDWLPYNDVDANTLWKIGFTPAYAPFNSTVVLPQHWTGLGLLWPYMGTEGARAFFCGNEDNFFVEGYSMFSYTTNQNYGVAKLRRYMNGQFSTPQTLTTDIWYRCGCNAEQNFTERMSDIRRPNDGLMICGGPKGQVIRMAWDMLHQKRGFNWTGSDGHVQWYGYNAHPVPTSWAIYDITRPKTTLNIASKNLRNE